MGLPEDNCGRVDLIRSDSLDNEALEFDFYMFQRSVAHEVKQESLPSGLILRFWRPSFRELRPVGVRSKAFFVWWVFHFLKIFTNRLYGVVVIYDGDTLVHYSGIFPRYFRFPFMGPSDLQVGDTWTSPKYRGLGLATIALRAIRDSYFENLRDLKFWYVVDQQNSASVRVVEKSGFKLFGRGVRHNRFSLRFLGFYEIANVK